MSIPGRQNINVGLPNESANSDSLYTAFTKIDQNFANLFACSSPFNTFTAGAGIAVNANANLGAVTVTNTGVTNIIAGTNITINQSNGNVTISATGSGNGGGLSSVGLNPVSTSRLTVTNTPLVTNGNMTIDLANSGVVEGTYNNPTVTVDSYGRITSAANGNIAGTVTSVGLASGAGIQVSGGPITSNGNITVTNTGVTRINAGSGIVVSSGNGNVTISAASLGGTVTSVGVSSSQLVVSNSPIVSSGTINIELPNTANFSGNVVAGGVKTDNLYYANGDPWDLQEAAGSNNQIQYNIGNDFAASANLTFNPSTNLLTVDGNANVGNINASGGNINGDIEILGNIGNVESILFDITHVDEHTETGILCWNAPDRTLNLHHTDGVVQQVGQELYALTLNSTGSNITNGSVVSFAGANTANGVTRLEIAPYIANGSIPTLYTLGVATQDIANGNIGFTTMVGQVRGLNTTGNTVGETWSTGDLLYASPNVAGGFTNVKPTAPNTVVPVAAVLKVDSTEGEIFARPSYEIQKSYGGFYSNATQTLAGANTATGITLNNTTTSLNVELDGGNPGRIIFRETGFYNVSISMQISANINGTQNIYAWVRKDGVDMPASTRAITTFNDEQLATLNWTTNISATTPNSYIQLYWAASGTNLSLSALAATAFSPSAPSVQVDVVQTAL